MVGTLKAEILYNGKNVASGEVKTNGVHNFICLKVKNPKWWWPNGMGNQELYECRVSLLDEKGKVQDAMTQTFGL